MVIRFHGTIQKIKTLGDSFLHKKRNNFAVTSLLLFIYLKLYNVNKLLKFIRLLYATMNFVQIGS